MTAFSMMLRIQGQVNTPLRQTAQLYLLYIQEGKGDSLPEIIAIFTRDLEVLVPLLFDERVVLHRHSVPHEVFLQRQYDTLEVQLIRISSHNKQAR